MRSFFILVTVCCIAGFVAQDGLASEMRCEMRTHGTCITAWASGASHTAATSMTNAARWVGHEFSHAPKHIHAAKTFAHAQWNHVKQSGRNVQHGVQNGWLLIKEQAGEVFVQCLRSVCSIFLGLVSGILRY
jgi:hypothetical protein